jgi:hypothetical protein
MITIFNQQIKSIYLGLIILALGVGTFIYHESNTNPKVCDSYTLNTQYKDYPPICYEQEKTSFQKVLNL